MAKKSASNAAIRVGGQLVNVLSDTYTLAVKTHGYHWNVTGSLFPQLHAQFGEQYENLLEAADDVAERLRALDLPAPGGMAVFLRHSAIKEADASRLSALAMIKDLLKSHEILRLRIEEARAVAENLADTASEDLMIERLRYHDKIIWMLRSQVT